MITKEQIEKWRKLKDDGMFSGVGEYTPPEFWEALDEIERLKRKVSKFHRLYQQANGKATRYARTIESQRESKLFYKRKIWAVLDVLPADANWHNAPDYICHFKAQMSAHSQQANHYQKMLEGLNAQRKNSMSIENAHKMALELAEFALGGYYDNERGIKFIEEWRKNNDC